MTGRLVSGEVVGARTRASIGPAETVEIGCSKHPAEFNPRWSCPGSSRSGGVTGSPALRTQPRCVMEATRNERRLFVHIAGNKMSNVITGETVLTTSVWRTDSRRYFDHMSRAIKLLVAL